jgi:DNA-binding NtrC family response regulator
VRPVGSTHATTVDVRVLAASNRDLKQMIQQGAFREDLFYRLNVIAMALPPLRERREDIPLLAGHFLEQFGQKHGRTLRLGPEALDTLLRYPWPGNVRELENAMERTAILVQHDPIQPDDFPPNIAAGLDPGASPTPLDPQTLEEAERAHIIQALERSGRKHSRAAEILGISRTTLWRKRKEYGLDK